LDRLKQTIARSRRDNSRIALLFIDLDRFKPVNDEFGHLVGDWLLHSAAQRMLGCLRESDTAARIGGDEFVILLPDLLHSQDALAVGERVCEALEMPFVTAAGNGLHISASIGVAIFPDHADNEHDLLRLGDEAMYRAKKAGRNRVEFLPTPSAPPSTANLITTGSRSVVHLTWMPAYACGEPDIDTEHRELLRLSNQLLEVALSRDTSPANLSAAFDVVLRKLAAHFRHEEAILHECGYLDLEEHREMHQTILEHARALRGQADSNSITVGKLVDFLVVEAISQHMLEADREFYPCLRSTGRASRSRQMPA
jgi:diguanylate cyclase (GGDEF)-like protein/hemerythrin-like metal-binding protein